jgi:hypothetical protein
MDNADTKVIRPIINPYRSPHERFPTTDELALEVLRSILPREQPPVMVNAAAAAYVDFAYAVARGMEAKRMRAADGASLREMAARLTPEERATLSRLIDEANATKATE